MRKSISPRLYGKFQKQGNSPCAQQSRKKMQCLISYAPKQGASVKALHIFLHRSSPYSIHHAKAKVSQECDALAFCCVVTFAFGALRISLSHDAFCFARDRKSDCCKFHEEQFLKRLFQRNNKSGQIFHFIHSYIYFKTISIF